MLMRSSSGSALLSGERHGVHEEESERVGEFHLLQTRLLYDIENKENFIELK